MAANYTEEAGSTCSPVCLDKQLSRFIGIKSSYNCSHRTSRRRAHSQCDRSEPGRFHLPVYFSKEFGTMGDRAYM